MFADPDLAQQIDAAEARLAAAIAAAADGALDEELGGGRAVMVRPGSPVNKLIGVGFGGALDETALERIERAWGERGEPARVELSSLAAPEVGLQLSRRGYQLHGFENVLGLALGEVEAAGTIEVEPAGDDEEWARVAVDGFMSADERAVTAEVHQREATEIVMRDMMQAAGFRRLVARIDGAAAGVATMRLDGEVALMCGATTLPAWRRRGVQAALLSARLAQARAAGARVAVVTTAPGSQSMRNVMRRGFALLYVRAVLIRAVSR